jgi:HSP20 family protein
LRRHAVVAHAMTGKPSDCVETKSKEEKIVAQLRFEDSLSSVLALQRELERTLRNPAFNLGPSGYGTYPPINVFDDKDHAVVVAEVPGLDLKSLDISSQGHTLTIHSERKPEPSGKDEGDWVGYHRRERAFGEFSRSIQLPEDFQPDKAEAKYENGLLIIRVPKHKAAKPRQITVHAA